MLMRLLRQTIFGLFQHILQVSTKLFLLVVPIATTLLLVPGKSFTGRTGGINAITHFLENMIGTPFATLNATVNVSVLVVARGTAAQM